MSRFPYRGVTPRVHDSCYVAPTAAIVGDVEIGERSSIWFGAVLRGDVMPIRVGVRTSIQDNCVVHATGGLVPTVVGDDCTVGHSVVLHGCKVGDRVLVGMGSILLDEVEIGSDTVIGAGSLLTARTKIPSGVLALGRPAKPVRDLTDEERERLLDASRAYQGLVRDYRGG